MQRTARLPAPGSFCDQVYSIDAAHWKCSWNEVILALFFKKLNIYVVHVSTAVCPEETADAYTYLLRNCMKLELMKVVLNNASYTCFSDGHKGSGLVRPTLCSLTGDRLCLQHSLKNIPAVGRVRGSPLTWISSYFPFNFSWLTIFHLICMKPLKYSDIDFADQAIITEGGNISRDQRTTTSRIVVKGRRNEFRTRKLQIISPLSML